MVCFPTCFTKSVQKIGEAVTIIENYKITMKKADECFNVKVLLWCNLNAILLDKVGKVSQNSSLGSGSGGV